MISLPKSAYRRGLRQPASIRRPFSSQTIGGVVHFNTCLLHRPSVHLSADMANPAVLILYAMSDTLVLLQMTYN